MQSSVKFFVSIFCFKTSGENSTNLNESLNDLYPTLPQIKSSRNRKLFGNFSLITVLKKCLRLQNIIFQQQRKLSIRIIE